MRVRYAGISMVLMLVLSIFGMVATATAQTATSTSSTKVSTPSPTATKAATTEPAKTATKDPTVPATATVVETATLAAEATTTGAAGTPVAETATAAPVTVVTLVVWYEQTPNGGPLKLSAIQLDANGVAGPSTATDSKITGSVDFADPKNNDLPRITIGDSQLDGYAVTPDDPNTVLRWTYFNDDSTLRPSTLVVQVKGSAGAYKGYSGTATFISRAPKAGGVVVIALNPPAA